MSEAKEQLRRKILEKRGLKACEKYWEMFHKAVPLLMPDTYPTNDKRYLSKVEACIKRGSPLTEDELNDTGRPEGTDWVY